MAVNVLAGIISIGIGFLRLSPVAVLLGVFWAIIPTIMWHISRKIEKVQPIDKLDTKEKEYVLEIGKRTWSFFETYLTKENNYLVPDNYQEDRKEKAVPRTSSTNIGLSLLAVISRIRLRIYQFRKGNRFT